MHNGKAYCKLMRKIRIGNSIYLPSVWTLVWYPWPDPSFHKNKSMRSKRKGRVWVNTIPSHGPWNFSHLLELHVHVHVYTCMCMRSLWHAIMSKMNLQMLLGRVWVLDLFGHTCKLYTRRNLASSYMYSWIRALLFISAHKHSVYPLLEVLLEVCFYWKVSFGAGGLSVIRNSEVVRYLGAVNVLCLWE